MNRPRVLCLWLALAACLPGTLAGEASGWRGRDFDADAEAVRIATVSALADAQLTLDAEAEREATGELVTGYREFREPDFGPDVAIETPPVSRMFPFFVKRKMNQGEYRVRARIEPREEGGSRLELRVEFLVPAVNRITYEHTKIERTSNGVIEAHFHDRVHRALSAPPAD